MRSSRTWCTSRSRKPQNRGRRRLIGDTSAWIEWLIDGRLHKTLKKEFPEKAQCVVPTIVQLKLADLHRQYKLATADAIVYATAIAYDADLLTCDAHFEKLPGIVLVRKNN